MKTRQFLGLGLLLISADWAVLASSAAPESSVVKPVAAIEQPSTTKQVSFTISTTASQTYEFLTQQAASMAQTLIAQGFSESPDVTDMVVSILGERNGQEVPILLMKVSRSEWQAEPYVEKWATYPGKSAMILLGFATPQVQQPPTAYGGSYGGAAYGGSEALYAPSSVAPYDTEFSSGTPRNSVVPGVPLEAGDPGYR